MKNTAVAIINFLNTLAAFAELLEKEMWAEVGYEADLNLKLGTGVSSNQKMVEFIKVLTAGGGGNRIDRNASAEIHQGLQAHLHLRQSHL